MTAELPVQPREFQNQRMGPKDTPLYLLIWGPPKVKPFSLST